MPAPVPKVITWDGSAWKADPMTVTVYPKTGPQEPVEIAGSAIQVTCTEPWLTPQNPESLPDRSWRVPMAVDRDRYADLAPPSGSGGEKVRAEIGSIPPPSVPWKTLSTTATVKVDVTSGPGADQTENLLDEQITYTVRPPEIRWTVTQKEPVPLREGGGTVTFRVTSGPLPPGWARGLELVFAFPTEPAKRRGLALRSVRQVADDDPARVALEVTVSHGKTCLRKVEEITDPPADDVIPLYIAHGTEYLGVACREVPVRLEPLDICIYLEKRPDEQYPDGQYPWEEPGYRVRVRKDRQRPTPEYSRITVSVGTSREGSSLPVTWTLEDATLDDGFDRQGGEETTYTAPSLGPWEEGGKPDRRSFRCLVGPGDEETCVDPEDQEAPGDDSLFSTAELLSHVELGPPLGTALVRVRVSPAGMPRDAGEFTLGDPKVLEAFHRQFTVEVDLGELAAARSRRRTG